MKLTLTHIQPEASSDCLSFQFEPETPFHWQAGQFLQYHLSNSEADNRKTKRYFTISSAPYEKFIQLTTRFTSPKGSTFKSDLKGLKIGDQIEANGPMGIFLLNEVSPNTHYVFIAGGIGITPFRSMLLELDHQNSKLPITLFYASRDTNIIFQPELENLQKDHPELKIDYFIGQNQINEAVIDPLIKQHPQAIFYLSGPQSMVESIQITLKEKHHLPHDQIKLDYFPDYPTI